MNIVSKFPDNCRKLFFIKMGNHKYFEAVKNVSIPSTVYKDDCGYCFKTMVNHSCIADSEHPPENQLNICLKCFQSFCNEHVHFHQAVVKNLKLTPHELYLNTFKLEKSDPAQISQGKKLKLEVNKLSDEELYEYNWSLVRFSSKKKPDRLIANKKDKFDAEIINKLNQVVMAKSKEYQDMKSSWKLEIKPCKHIEEFEIPPFSKELKNVCDVCELDTNLWLCLHCGHVGCGREQVGVKGFSHALKHYKKTNNHDPLAIKLGSLSKDSSDIYCYSCDDEVTFDDNDKLVAILSKYGISPDKWIAKEKTLVEMQVEQNLVWDFQLDDSNGDSFKKLTASKNYGCGLINLGNSCYMNSVIQVLFNNGVADWDLAGLGDFPMDILNPSLDLKCQLIKLRDAFKKNPESYQFGIKPAALKQCIGEGSSDFGSGKQQDSMEFLTYFIDKLDKNIYNKENLENPNDKIRFIVEDRVECMVCHRVKYCDDIAEALQVPLLEDEEPQVLDERLATYFNGERVNIKCSYCRTQTVALKASKLKSAPSTLIVNPIRIRLHNWIPIKTNKLLKVPGVRDNDLLQISQFKSKGLQSGELEFSDSDDDHPEDFQPIDEYMNAIVNMGFSRNAATRALYSTNNKNTEVALNWLFEHIDDHDLNAEFVIPSVHKNKVDSNSLNNMVAMGLSEALSRKALILNNGDVPRSVDWVFSNMDDDGKIEDPNTTNPVPVKQHGIFDNFLDYTLSAVICHEGNSIHSGHYVAFIKRMVDNELTWVLYNDEKLVAAKSEKNLQEIEKKGYIFIFNRVTV